VAEFAMQGGLHWFFAGAVGVALASVWNFTMTQLFTWRISRHTRPKRRLSHGSV
jgi:putative flippase GtrA